MQYIALKEMTTSQGNVQPGDLVPEAAGWDLCWFTTGFVAAYPDEMAQHVRAQLNTGHLQMHGQQFGQQFVGGAISQAAQGAADLLVVRDPEPASPPSDPAPPLAVPTDKQPILADAAPVPAADPLPAAAVPAAVATPEEAAVADDAGADDASGPDAVADAPTDASTPDRPRGRMGRRRPK